MYFSNHKSSLVLYIKAVNITGFVHSETDRPVIEKMYARWQNGDEIPRNYVTPSEEWWRVIIWKVETSVNLPPFRVLKKEMKNKRATNPQLYNGTWTKIRISIERQLYKISSDIRHRVNFNFEWLHKIIS